MADTDPTALATQAQPTGPPLKAKPPQYGQFSQWTMTVADHRQGLGEDMSGHYVGPMPPREFLDRFMTLPKEQPIPSFSRLGFGRMKKGLKENALYEPLVSATICPFLMPYVRC